MVINYYNRQFKDLILGYIKKKQIMIYYFQQQNIYIYINKNIKKIKKVKL